MDVVRKHDVEVSAAGLNEGAQWEVIGKEVTARLKAITQNVKRVLIQEGHSDAQVDYNNSTNNQAEIARWKRTKR
jgi:hypothetical protein